MIIALLAAGCDVKPDKKVSYYYDTDSLLLAQKKVLLQRGAAIQKKAKVGAKNEKATIEPDSVTAWEREFQIFEKININKPGLKDVYQVKEYDDIKSNLKIRAYTSSEEDVEVPYLKIYYLNEPTNLRKIEAKYVEANPIYRSQRYLEFTFDDHTGSPLLHKYRVRGSQKMIFKDSVSFEVNGKVKL